jgi:DNA-binding NtrC family response regulator
LEVSELIADAIKPGARACLSDTMSMEESVRAFKTVLMKEALAQCGGVKDKAARKLGISDVWLHHFLNGRNPPLQGEHKSRKKDQTA